ncbi:MAG: AI-2E family transporter [Chitinophagaceae bacterium]
MNTFPLSKSVSVLLLLFLLIGGLYFTREFAVPVAIAGLLSMLLVPLSRRFEKKGMNRAVATLLCILVMLLVIAGIAALIAWQVSDLAQDTAKMQERIIKMGEQLRQYISKTLGISKEQQQQMLEKQQSSASDSAGTLVKAVLASLMSTLVNAVLVVVYIFLFMFFRGHLKKFILQLVSPGEKQKSEIIINDVSKVSQKYLSGMGMMIVCLWIMYGIGYTIVGVKNAIFFAILCGLLEIVPFVGNVTGTAITLLMAVSQGGSSNMIIGILITYGVVQFIQTYLLEPLVVGAEVNINPLFTILVIIVGEMIWGIPGMILAIPILGMVKIICDHVQPLKPFGFLIGEEKKAKEESGVIKKIKGWFK